MSGECNQCGTHCLECECEKEEENPDKEVKADALGFMSEFQFDKDLLSRPLSDIIKKICGNENE